MRVEIKGVFCMFDTVKSKIIFSTLVFGVLGLGAVYGYLNMTFHNFSNETSKRSLTMLSQSIFQTLSQSMLAGDPKIVAETIEKAKEIDGIMDVQVQRSIAVNELFGSHTQMSGDVMIKKIFETKQPAVMENSEKGHAIRLLQPLVAEEKCLACHTITPPTKHLNNQAA